MLPADPTFRRWSEVPCTAGCAVKGVRYEDSEAEKLCGGLAVHLLAGHRTLLGHPNPPLQFPEALRHKQGSIAILRVAQEPNRNREPEPSEPLFPKPKAEPEPPEPFSRNRNRNRNRPFLLNYTKTQKNPFDRGTAGTENRNRSNRSIPEP